MSQRLSFHFFLKWAVEEILSNWKEYIIAVLTIMFLKKSMSENMK
ncbi:hypothetical protein [Aliikangiella sp. G2MR2-5]|nr:hypothetical protein [Aliikangiella sp. G2MR2-5]